MKNKPQATITQLNNPYTQEKTLAAHRERKRKRIIRRRSTLITVIGLLFLGMSSMNIMGSKQKISELRAETEDAQQELDAVQTYQDDLNYYIGMLEDEEYVAKLARGEYYLTQEDEIVFNLPEDAKSDQTSILEESEENTKEAAEKE